MNDKTKTILLSSLIAVMIMPLSVAGLAQAGEGTEKYEPADVSEAIRHITPYVTLDETGLVKFTTEKKYIPLHPHTILVASDYIDMQNSYRSQAQENPDEKPEIDDELEEKFSKFIADVQEKKSNLNDSGNGTQSLDFVLPQAFALGEVCGGAPWNPQPEPEVVRKYTSSGAANHLLSDGYHLVPFYATLHHGDDYAKNTSAFGCNNGELRTQGLVKTTNSYNHQSPEPNPEILSYSAPVWWWDGYVIAWHLAN